VRSRRRRRRATDTTTRTLGSFVRAAAARALVRRALRVARGAPDEGARRSIRDEIRRHAESNAASSARGGVSEASRAAHALSEGRRRVKELEEMMLMVR